MIITVSFNHKLNFIPIHQIKIVIIILEGLIINNHKLMGGKKSKPSLPHEVSHLNYID